MCTVVCFQLSQCCIALLPASSPELNVSGWITSDTTWSSNNFFVGGDIIVAPNATLKILGSAAANVSVRFSHAGPGIELRAGAKLLAEHAVLTANVGEVGSGISVNGAGTEIVWRQVKCQRQQSCGSGSGLLLQSTLVSTSVQGMAIMSSVLMDVNVSSCTLDRCAVLGGQVNTGSYYKRSLLAGGGTIEGHFDDVLLYGNDKISPSSFSGVNTILQNDIGISTSSSVAPTQFNIVNNTVNYQLTGSVAVTLNDVYWGKQSESEVRATIQDLYSGYGGGVVTIGTLASTPHCHSMFPSDLMSGCDGSSAPVAMNVSGGVSAENCFRTSDTFICNTVVNSDEGVDSWCSGSNASGVVCDVHIVTLPLCTDVKVGPGPVGPMNVDIGPLLADANLDEYIDCDVARVSTFSVGNTSVVCNASSSGISALYCAFEVLVSEGKCYAIWSV